MGHFVNFAKSIGVDKIAGREAMLKRAFDTRGFHGELLFYICGYDYIQSPKDGKFNALREQWLQRNATLAYNHLNLGSGGSSTWAKIQMAIPQPASGSAQNFSQMHKALDIATHYNMINQNLKEAMEAKTAKTVHHLTTWAQEKDDFSSILSPYWGSDLARIGLRPMASTGFASKIKNHFALKKQKQDELAALMSIPTRGRASHAGPTRARR